MTKKMKEMLSPLQPLGFPPRSLSGSGGGGGGDDPCVLVGVGAGADLRDDLLGEREGNSGKTQPATRAASPKAVRMRGCACLAPKND